MKWQEGTSLLAVDWAKGMLQHVWPGGGFPEHTDRRQHRLSRADTTRLGRGDPRRSLRHLRVITIQMPIGLFLHGGVTLKLDGGKPDRLDVQTCDQKGCYIQMPVSNDMLQAMGKGKQMIVSFQNLGKQDINIPVPLSGFMVAYQKIQRSAGCCA